MNALCLYTESTSSPDEEEEEAEKRGYFAAGRKLLE
jgi:hypothetical protein